MKTKDPYAILRWSARILGAVIVFFTLFIAIGESIDSYRKNGSASLEALNWILIVTFFFWFLGMAGIIWAWWKEGPGGFLSLAATVIFLILVPLSPESTFSPVLLIYLLPSILFIMYWWMKRTSPKG
jgi:hypothetical protein